MPKNFQQVLVKLGFTLNARELSALTWSCIFLFAILLMSKEARVGLKIFFRQLVKWKVLIPILCLFGWIVAGVWIGSKTFLWKSAFTKDTVYWSIMVGVRLFINYDKVSKPDFLKHAFANSLGIAALLEYFMNLSAFPFLAEFLLQPIIAFLIFASLTSRQRSNTQNVHQLVNFLLGIIAFVLLTYTAVDFCSKRQTIDWAKIFLPAWLTIWVFPYIYLFSLVSNYEIALIKLNWAAKGGRAPWWAKLALICKLHLRIKDVRAAAKGGTLQIANASSFSEAWQSVTEFQRSLRRHEQIERENQDRLIRYAGSQQTDADGRRLDRREFEETKRALQWLATCQMGWYRREGRYRDDLLGKVLNDNFTRFGLPKPSGDVPH